VPEHQDRRINLRHDELSARGKQGKVNDEARTFYLSR
jgi:hypothetical protein